MSEMMIFEDETGTVEVRIERDTVWLTQRQIADLLDTTSENIVMHLRNIYAEAELVRRATTKKILAVRQDIQL